MKVHLWDSIIGPAQPQRARRARRKSVAAILRGAYRRFAGDALTRRAVRRYLPDGV